MYQNMLEFVKGLYVPWNWTGRLMVGVTSHKGVGSPGNLNWASTLCEEFTAGRRVRKGFKESTVPSSAESKFADCRCIGTLQSCQRLAACHCVECQIYK